MEFKEIRVDKYFEKKIKNTSRSIKETLEKFNLLVFFNKGQGEDEDWNGCPEIN